ncbi:hypothetical protein BP6252_08418 [Coleophoma cylindrospora]|uniref:Uncharacterized protein n=1 Tax=Coleophoma cylindrospora TaxID=1849047 RepID=A0A3D8R614_9HELO|nr:hypothetical protein BP6252_08418 [Coleophoma cylindrospora]
MPRRLPWEQGTSSTVAKRATKPSAAPVRKRRKLDDPDNVSSEDDGVHSTKKDPIRNPSTSPPPEQSEPPVERFMDEGIDRDDKYRMVEDEFLSTAKRWTVHLHTAEYHRQKRLARSKNAITINSISRPVTQKMPQQTRRKLESVDRSKAQRSMLLGLLGRKDVNGEDSNSDEADDLPYVGTSLHGLMDGPRKSAGSLTRFGSITSCTRAAAGFQKSTQHLSQTPKHSTLSQPRQILDNSPMYGSATESSDDDDDLDGPIAAPILNSTISTAAVTKNKEVFASYARPIAPAVKVQKAQNVETPVSRTAADSLPLSNKSAIVVKSRNPFEEADTTVPEHLSKVRKRLAQARFLKANKDKKEQKKLDIVPTFL